MGKIKSLVKGERFGNLTVINFDHVNKYRESCWLCECDCGNRVVVSRSKLITGNTSSCGCRKHGPKREDITGQRFGRLTVAGFDHTDQHRNSYWLCECDCGNKTVVTRGGLTSGNTTSCGCYNRERVSESTTTHGMSKTLLYKVWKDMHTRCENKNGDTYHRYGARGICVCSEWGTFENFRDWALETGYKQGLTIDRIDNDRGYSPSNCRWVNWSVQGNNRSTNHIVEYAGRRHNIMEWTKILGINYSTLWARIKRNDMRDFEAYFNNI